MTKTQVLSSQLNSTTYDETYEAICQFLSTSDQPGYITVNNVHTVVEGVVDSDYGEIINGSFMALPDGKPLSVVARWKGDSHMERVFGPTLFEKVLDWSQHSELNHYFFGSTPTTIEKLKNIIQTKYPDTRLAGFFSPPFRSFSPEENESYIQDMNGKHANIIWIGLGAPKQEKWMAENIHRLNNGLMIGIGAGFDYLTGDTKHAPSWMKNYSLEWVYRLIQEPKRLWKRYCVTIPIFIGYNLLELIGLKKFN